MSRLITALSIVSIGLLASLVNAPAPALAAQWHLHMERSAPAADSENNMVHAVTLWFSEAPQDNSVTLRLIDESGDLVETGTVTRDAEEATAFTTSLNPMLAPGTYTVSWRAMGDDGHVVRGEFVFGVSTS